MGSACSACVHGAVGVVVGQGQRPRVALVGVVGVVREGFGAKEARGAKRVYGVVQGERGARRAAWCNDGRDERVLSVVQGERGAKEEVPTMGHERKGRGRRLPTDRPSS